MKEKNANERYLALNTLIDIVEHKQSIAHIQTPLTPFAQNLVYGVCRHYFRLRALLNRLLSKSIKKKHVELTLLLGLYQLDVLGLPEYAVLHETVSLLNKPHLSWAKGLVNGVLRRYIREKSQIHQLLKEDPKYPYFCPDWLLKKIKLAWPLHWESILKATFEHPPMSLRVNALRHTRDAYQKILQSHQINSQCLSHTTHGLSLEKPIEVYQLPGFDIGDISVQDGAAQIAASLLQLEPNLNVLDACAAPGGKTCHILEVQPNLKRCVALDIDEKRIAKMKANFTRLHLDPTVIMGDACQTQTWWDGTLFDRILLDAPCSATGVIRRHPDILLLRTDADILTITNTQAILLNALWPLLRPGGILVYSTCSIFPQENELQIAKFNQNNSDCLVCSEQRSWGHFTGHGWQILPGEHAMDGFFYSVLKKI